jgi:deoxyadenosine/deoxycytidine kinase
MYIVEGNIGVGKSTFLKEIKAIRPGYTVVQEPVENWAANQHGQSLLSLFYNDQKRWTYTLEVLAMMSRVREHVYHQQRPQPSHLFERSIYSGHYCFAHNGRAGGFLNDIEWNIYSQWVEFLMENECQTPKGFIYLRAEPEVCLERIQKRSRTGEDGISMEYLQQIHDWHEKFLIQKAHVTPEVARVPVLVLDCSTPFAGDSKKMLEFSQKIDQFIDLTASAR